METKTCPYCGEEILAEAKKCKHCGEWLEKPVPESLKTVELSEQEQVDLETEKEGFFEHYVVKNCNPLFQFSGQLSRKDFWVGSVMLGIVTYSVLSTAFILYLSGFLTGFFGRGALTVIITLIVLPLIVALGMTVRRLHDIGQNGWLVLLSIVPIANIYLLYLLCQKGEVTSGKVTHKSIDYVCWATVVLVPFIVCFIAIQSGANLWSSDVMNENYFTDNDTIITEVDTIVSFNQENIILKGVIAEKIGFSMNLQQNGDEIEGTEHYDNQKSDVIVSIKGTIDDEGNLTLYEYDGGIRTGSFSGNIDGSSYYGTFTNAKGNKMPFSADVLNKEDMENEGSIVDETVDKYQSLKSDLEEFIKDTQECIDGGIPTGSTLGSHYEEYHQGLWKRYRQIEPEMTSDQKEYANTLLNVIDELFEDWAAKEIDLSDYD